MKPRRAALLFVSAAVLSVSSPGRAAEPAAKPAAKPAKVTPASPAAATKAATTAPAAQKAGSPSGPAAKVNGVAIPGDRVAKEVEQEQARRAAAGAPPEARDPKVVRDWVLDRFITTEVVYQAAKDGKVAPTDADLKVEMDKVKGRFPSPEEFEKALHEEGMSATDLQDEIRKSMAVRNWLKKEVEETVTVADADVKAYFDSHPADFKKPETIHVSHIAVHVEKDAMPGEKAKAKEKIEAVAARLKKGEDFAAVAKTASEDPGSAKDGGDLGVYARGQGAPPEFEDAAFGLKKDETSGVVETGFGYHIIRVTDRSPAGVFTFDEVKSSVKEHLLGKAREEKAKVVVDDLKKKAKIEKL